MNELIKISALSSKYGISTRTLRYYEDVGLIKSIRNDDYAYRTYNEEEIKKLEQILILRRLSISVKDIKRIFDTTSSEIIVKILGKKVQDIDDEIALLHELKDIVLNFIRQINQADFNNDSDVKMLYEKAKEIENQIVNPDKAENNMDLNRLIEISEKLKKSELRVEIGRSEEFTHDISQFGVGSIIELDRNANDMVDLFINEKLIAKGSIIVIEGKFGIKILEVIQP